MNKDKEQEYRKECREFMATLPGYARSGFSSKQAEMLWIEARRLAEVGVQNRDQRIKELEELVGNLSGHAKAKVQFPHKECPELIYFIEKATATLNAEKGE